MLWISYHYCSQKRSQDTDKLKIMNKITREGFQNINAIRTLEEKLELAGYFELTQFIRCRLHHIQFVTPESRRWCQKVIEADIEGRKIVQQETYIQEEIETLRNAYWSLLSTFSDKDIASQLERWARKLKDLNEQYWIHERDLYRLEATWAITERLHCMEEKSRLVPVCVAAQGLCWKRRLLRPALRMLREASQHVPEAEPRPLYDPMWLLYSQPWIHWRREVG